MSGNGPQDSGPAAPSDSRGVGPATGTTPTASLITPIGRGAVATIMVRGAASLFDAVPPLFAAANGKSVALQPVNRVCFGRWGTDTAETEDVVICRVSEQTTEIHCHGGTAAAERIQRDLAERGVPAVDWEQQLAIDGASTVEIEIMRALTRSTTPRTAKILLEQQALLVPELRSLPELQADELKSRLDRLLHWSRFGLKLTEPWQVVLCGLPNVGKSSLINALLGYTRSIVFDQPRTTRDVLTAEAAFDGWPVELSDTAGLREQGDVIESIGVERARHRLENADLSIVVIDRSNAPEGEVLHLINANPDALLVANKCDLGDAWGQSLPGEAIVVSSLRGDGVETLASHIANRLVPIAPPAGTPLPVTQRQVDLLRDAREAVDRGDLTAAGSAIERCIEERESV